MEPEQNTPLNKVLVRLARQRRDQEAWGELYVRMWPFVLAQNYRCLGGRRDLAEDAAQDVFFRLIRYCAFEHLEDPVDFYAYLTVVCINVSKTYLFRQHRRKETALAW